MARQAGDPTVKKEIHSTGFFFFVRWYNICMSFDKNFLRDVFVQRDRILAQKKQSLGLRLSRREKKRLRKPPLSPIF